MNLTTLTNLAHDLKGRTVQSPLELAKDAYEKAAAVFETAKAALAAATERAAKAVAALIKQPNDKNAKAAATAQTEQQTAVSQLDTASATASATAVEYERLKKSEKAVTVTGADIIQISCFVCAFNGVAYEQSELEDLAEELTGKRTVGQYGYFRRVARLAKLYGIEVKITLPE